MNILVVGCGAMGSIYAALLARAGNQVSVLDTNAAHVTAINAKGLRVWGASGDTRVSIVAATQAHDLPKTPLDLVICAVKARHAQSAARSMLGLINNKTIVLTIQNGLGSAEIVADLVGVDRLAVGVAQGFGASLPSPGVAHHNDMKAIRIGAYQGLAYAKVEALATMWVAAGFDAAATEDIIAMQWEKLICNVAYSAPCAITGQTLGEVLADPNMSRVSQAAAAEAYQIAQAAKIQLSFDDPTQKIREFAQRMPQAKPSVLLDLEVRKPSEIEAINGAVPIEADKLGMQAPINKTLTELVLALEQNQD